MKRALLLCITSTMLTACASGDDTGPVLVATPGIPSPELALQQSIDRVHAFMASMRERLDTPVVASRPLETTRPTDITGTRTPAQPAPLPAPVNATPVVRRHEAAPLFGKGGVVWFAFGDGTPTIDCAPGDICIMRLAPGETAETSALTLSDTTNWHADLVRGTRGIHAGWAVAFAPGKDAHDAWVSLATNARTYRVALAARSPGMRLVAFTHSAGEPAAQPDLTPHNGQSSFATSAPDFRFVLSGDSPAWKPLRVYRDANRTFIQFPKTQVAASPRLAILAPAGAAARGYQAVGDSYVVDAPITEAVLTGEEPGSPTVRITYGEPR